MSNAGLCRIGCYERCYHVITAFNPILSDIIRLSLQVQVGVLIPCK